MFHRLFVGCREDEAGFSIVELATVIVILGLLIGMGIWLMYGAGSTTGARTAQGQIAQDLKLCAKKAETEKKMWGILYYAKNYSDPTHTNVYRWYYFDGYGNIEGTDCTLQWVAPPVGAAPVKSGTQLVPLQDGAKIFGTFGSTWPSHETYLYLRFKQVGSTMVTQYGTWSGGVRVWADIADAPGYLEIKVSDKKEDRTKDVKIYKLGYVGFQ